MNILELINMPVLGDERGSLVVMESLRNVPIDIKRVYFLYGTRLDVPRGFHAHKALKQVAVCVSGRCEMLLDNGKIKENILLDSPSKAVLIDRLVWHEMHNFSSDCVLLVLADDYYNEEDYIRNYDDFLRFIE